MAVEGLMVEGGLQLQLSCIEYWWRWCCIAYGTQNANSIHCIASSPTSIFQRVSSKNWGLFSQIHFTKNTALHCACPWSAVSLQWQADHTQRHRQTGWVSHILYVCKNSMTGRPHTDTHMDGRGGLGGRTAWKCKAQTCLLICTDVSVHLHVLMYQIGIGSTHAARWCVKALFKHFCICAYC